jgi:hypothetical protein
MYDILTIFILAFLRNGKYVVNPHLLFVGGASEPLDPAIA